ncbi:hypothetical protein BDV25DRAFT_162322 [Aspergillus avenaceus]|uniref:Uncharacterized protein n=1 Tax=Aspergillus avenaceus TaxID=36643 RepID=A0A5N6TJI2_ASPAV|nr:hypothetical protein BDV25DRAFT_162322 [Aspergillus avenaceus]
MGAAIDHVFGNKQVRSKEGSKFSILHHNPCQSPYLTPPQTDTPTHFRTRTATVTPR